MLQFGLTLLMVMGLLAQIDLLARLTNEDRDPVPLILNVVVLVLFCLYLLLHYLA